MRNHDVNTLSDGVAALLGLGFEPKELTFLQISLRGLVVFAATLVMIRLGDRRCLTKKSPFDQVLIVILASVLARAVNGSAAFFPTIGAAALLVFFHRGLAFASCRWPALADVLKGRSEVLVEDGEVKKETMRRNNIPIEDVQEDLHLSAKIDDLKKVKIARLEASGDISFILKEKAA